MPGHPLDVDTLRANFEDVAPGTVGVEEEVMVLEADTLALSERAPELLRRLDGDPRFKLELPASQLEIALGPFASALELARALAEARRAAAAVAGPDLRLAAAGVHPSSPGRGALNPLPAYAHTIAEFGPVAVRQLVCALQVHVAVGGAERTLAVYNALRSHLPLLAALAANAPYYEGRDTGLASVRPKLGELLPRQGVPPPLESWAAFAEALRWGVRAQAMPDPGRWWWELRPHVRFGTLELRVPDAQSTVADAGAIALVAQALVRWLSARHDAGEPLDVAPTWRIAENRWSACRHGVHGTMADLDTGERRSTSECLEELVATLGPWIEELGGPELGARARALCRRGGADAQREAGRRGGPDAVTAALVDCFLADLAG
jgi:carboxylate-amine ligase